MMNIFAFSMALTFTFIASLFVLGVWIWAIVDIIKSKKSTNEKIVWIVVLVLLNIIGAIIYFLMRNKDIKTNNKELKRSSDNKVLAGVCGGIGEYLQIDPTVIRLIWVLLSIFSIGTGILLYILAALIMPGQDKKDKKEKKERSNIVPIALALSGIAIVLILSVTIIALVALVGHVDTGGVSKEAHISFENEIAGKVTHDFIRSHHNYLNNSGNNLFCHTIMETDDSICDQYNDPYGVQIRHPECFEVRCKFDSSEPGIHGYTVEAIVVEDRVKRIGFHEITEQKLPEELSKITKEKMPEEREQITHEVRTKSDCERAGFNVLFPESNLSSGPLRCETDDGTINISTDICIDQCGDGICQAVVCMGEGCPCAESSRNCPADCK
ncbi:MAG: PspC domain-containing protein [Candidatus Woesearchaeota archaeon]